MPDTIKAVAGVSGPYDMAAGWEARPLLTRETFEHHSGARSEADARERAVRLNLADVAGRIEQPCLVVAGKRDRLVSWEQTKKIAQAPPGEFVLYDDGTHVCNNIPFKYRPLVADWIRDQLV
jgi:pimeloyl-ACP methyl ester carboxylesterase